MKLRTLQRIACGAALASLAACGGGGSGSSSTDPITSSTPPPNGNVSMTLSDASTEDWATIGVKVLSIALVPQGGGSDVTVYTAPATPPTINLVQLDQLGELIGNASVPVGTYTGAVVTISANPGDVLLTAASDPSNGFAAAPGATIPSNDIQIQNAKGTAPNLTVTVPVDFVAPLQVASNSNNQLDLEFDLAHPAFLVGRTPVGGGATIWAVNFRGPLRHHRVADIAWFVLRHAYGDVTAASGTSMTVTREFPTEPIVSPETYVTTTQSFTISLDQTAGAGTIFYDLDSKPVTPVTISNFSQLSSALQSALASGSEQVRVAARYQEDGTLVATRIFASTSFDTVWLSPEGHVLHVNPLSGMLTVQNDLGQPVDFLVNSSTLIYFRAPQDAVADATPISTDGAQFVANGNLVRGFKIHATVDATVSPMVAESIDIETARFDGTISSSSTTSFTYTHDFRTAADDYQSPGNANGMTLAYIPDSMANGTSPVPSANGMAIEGYKWWDFAYPVSTFDCCGSTAIADWVSATNQAIVFGGTAGAIPAYGASFAAWNSAASTPGWGAAESILAPSLLPLGSVVTPLTQTSSGSTVYSFTMTVPGAATGTTATVDLSTAADSATLVYQVDFTTGILTITPLDITQAANLTTLEQTLTAGALVRIYAVPVANASNTATAYVLVYYAGDLPSS
jgi:Domain of unknown function (DUF4382)